MATYTWHQLTTLWKRGELTPEQAIGQLIQWGEEQERRMTPWPSQLQALERSEAELTRQVADLESLVSALQGRIERLEVMLREQNKGNTAS